MLETRHRGRAATRFELALDRIVSSNGVLDALKIMGELAQSAKEISPDLAVDSLRPLVAGWAGDPLGAYLGLFALSGISSGEVDAILVDALASGDQGLAEHAAWGLSRRRPVAAAVPSLVDLADRGGFSQMLSELALESWMREMPDIIWQAGKDTPERLWHLSGQVPHSPAGNPPSRHGMRIAQILMQGKVDAALSAPGSGDGGGLITLQVGLTRELAGHEEVSDVYLITRSIEDPSGLFDEAKQEMAPGATLARLGFGGSGYIATADMWPYRAELERGLRELLVSDGPFDALHLRFADVGTLVGARLAEELGIPVFFTLAPDPHAVIASAERDGSLTRENFAPVDLDHHYFFRTWLVEWMLERAERLALLPRADQRQEFNDLVGVDIGDGSDRFRVIREGIDTALAAEARQIVSGSTGSAVPPVIGELKNLIDDLPEQRQGLPIILSVGRLNRVKGMDRVVAAWAGDHEIRKDYNLLIVGGDLANPSAEEEASLDAISAAAGEDPHGLLMMGGRSHSDVAVLMSAVAEGVEGIAESRGIYVSGSEKEEFGLAIVEALAAGLPVVAPVVGGPATYVDDCFTGYLVDTTQISRIREGIRWAGDVRYSDIRADAARRMVRSHLSLSTMADQLVRLYDDVRQKHSSAS